MDPSEVRRIVHEAQQSARKRSDERTGLDAEHDVEQWLSERRGLAQMTLAARTVGWKAARTYWMNREGQSSYHVVLEKPDGRTLTIEMVLPDDTSRLVFATHVNPDQHATRIHDVSTLGRYIAPDMPQAWTRRP